MAVELMMMAKGGSSSLVILTSGASGRINALFSVRALRILVMLINAFVLLLFLPFSGRRRTSSISPKDDARNYRKGMPVRRRAGPTTVTIGMQVVDEKDLDQFMTNYLLLLCSLKEQLQQHVRVHAMEAVMACWELEQSLQSLTGTGATKSDDNDDQVDSDVNLYDGSFDGPDSMGFGPLIPTETERSLWRE